MSPSPPQSEPQGRQPRPEHPALAAHPSLASAWKVIPGLQSRDIAATVRFYTEELHFLLGGTYCADADADEPQEPGQELTFCSVAVGDRACVNIYHGLCEDKDHFRAGWVLVAMGTEQLDEYYGVLREKGRVEVVEEIGDRPWGYRQFSVRDGDGNKLTFFRFLEGGNPGGGEEEEA